MKDPQDGRRVNVEADPGMEERFAPLFTAFAAQLADLYAEYSDAYLAVILAHLVPTARNTVTANVRATPTTSATDTRSRALCATRMSPGPNCNVGIPAPAYNRRSLPYGAPHSPS
ncbi:hypothetical protein ADL12_10100, partial [Streptomyces regalis]